MIDYTKIGLKCGIEIHQQVEGKKLFCSCPAMIREDQPDLKTERYLRASAGETGEIDIAAKHEMEKQKQFIYEFYSDTNCLVELDEEPPHILNQEALGVALQVALMLKSKIADTIQVMRKTVVDGSNTSGFQRTALVARGGSIDNVGIQTICIEEDAARIIKQEDSSITYRLDRLGIPLIEIGTEPDIKSPQQCKEVAEKIGLILRSTGKVKRGIGTIRQDVNVSVRDGARIEIKGAQELKLLPKLVENECIRQLSLIETKKQLKKTKIIGKKHNITSLFAGTESKIISDALKNNGAVLAAKLPNFKGFIGREVQPGRRLGTEFSEYARVKAGVGGIFHSDELPRYGITEQNVNEINKILGCKKNDAFVLIADKKEKSEKAIDAVLERAKLCFEEVPKEVRKANIDGTSSYLRPMPGSARMYPETDVKLIRPDTKNIKIPELIGDKTERYIELGLGGDLAALMSKSEKAWLFEEFIKKFEHINPPFIAETVLSTPKTIRRKENIDVDVCDEHFDQIFTALDKGEISKDSVYNIILELGRTGRLWIEKHRLMSDKELEDEIRRIIKENKGLAFNALIGKVMEKLRGKAEGKKIAEFVKNFS